MSSFFTLPASQRKRKRDDRAGAPASKKRGVASNGNERKGGRKDRDESISGSDSEDDDISERGDGSFDEESGSESDEGETAADRRLRLAERYLDNIKEEVDEVGFDAAEIDRDLIAERLKEDVDESKGRVYRQIASQLSFTDGDTSFFRADTQSTTAIAVHHPYVYTVSKDKTLIKWELATPGKSTIQESSKRPPRPQRKKPKKVKFVRGIVKPEESEEQGHTGHILSVAVSPSGQFVATGGADRKLIVWDAETLTPLKTFTQHRDSVSGLSFTKHISSGSSGEQLFSASFDRTIKTWSLSPGSHAYVETLFGHQDHVASVASLTTDQCISVGARDRTARLWKVVEEAQLVFRGGSTKGGYADNNLDCIAPLPPSHFVTGSDSGSLCLWSVHKKKPVYTVHLAHGADPLPPLDDLSSEIDPEVAAKNAKYMKQNPRWITALATLPGTDIVLSGSWDGWIRVWRVTEDKRQIIPVGTVGRNPQALSAYDKLTFDGQGNDSSMEVDQQILEESQEEAEGPVKGVVNGIAVFERRLETTKLGDDKPRSQSKSSESETKGLCIVAAVGKEHRLGRWKCYSDSKHSGPAAGGKNGAVVIEVPFSTDLAGKGENATAE